MGEPVSESLPIAFFAESSGTPFPHFARLRPQITSLRAPVVFPKMLKVPKGEPWGGARRGRILRFAIQVTVEASINTIIVPPLVTCTIIFADRAGKVSHMEVAPVVRVIQGSILQRRLAVPEKKL